MRSERRPLRHRLTLTPLLALSLLLLRPHSVEGQAGAAVLGGVGGLVVGGYTTVAIYVTKARFGRYLFSPDEFLALRPETLPVIVTPVAGALLGLESSVALGRSAGWGALGFITGAAVGGLTGKLLSDSEEGPWAGAVIGSGAGLLVGVVLGAIDGLDDDGAAAPLAFSWSIPWGGG